MTAPPGRHLVFGLVECGPDLSQPGMDLAGADSTMSGRNSDATLVLGRLAGVNPVAAGSSAPWKIDVR